MREEEKDEGGGKEEGKEVGRRQNKKQMAIDVCAEVQRVMWGGV